MSDKFAKLFDTERGQILVMLSDGADNEPEIRFFAKPDGLGICSIALSFPDSDEGWDAAEHVFGKVDQDGALRATAEIFNMASELTGGAA